VLAPARRGDGIIELGCCRPTNKAEKKNEECESCVDHACPPRAARMMVGQSDDAIKTAIIGLKFLVSVDIHNAGVGHVAPGRAALALLISGAYTFTTLDGARMSSLAGRLGLILLFAALCLGAPAAHAQAAPVTYWLPGWPLGFGGSAIDEQSSNSYGD